MKIRQFSEDSGCCYREVVDEKTGKTGLEGVYVLCRKDVKQCLAVLFALKKSQVKSVTVENKGETLQEVDICDLFTRIQSEAMSQNKALMEELAGAKRLLKYIFRESEECDNDGEQETH